METPTPTKAELIDLAQARRDAQRRSELNEIRRLTGDAAAAQAYRETIEKYAPLLTVPSITRSRALTDLPHHTWVLLLSDWHIGQKTSSGMTGGLFEQSLSRTRTQIAELTETLSYLHEIASGSEQIDDLYILGLGDFHEGDGMRPRQATEIDETVTEQCVDVVNTLSGLIQSALTRFRRVVFHNVGGNHDRVSQKAGLGGLGELAYHDTYSWLAGAMLEREFTYAQLAGRLRFKNWTTFFGYDIIAGHRFVFEHGASFRTSSGSYGGIGWYPIQNAAQRYVQMLDGADFICMGHFHTAACLPLGKGWQVLNGALPPSTPFVQSSFKKINTPSQTLLDIHAKHGLSAYRPIYLPHSGMVTPKALWTSAAKEQSDWFKLGEN